MTNPFKPSAGSSPPLLVGREAAIDAFDESIEDGPGAPARLSRLTGARGVGKTVMLTALGERAQSRGWIVIAETATSGLVGRLTAEVQRQTELVVGRPKRGPAQAPYRPTIRRREWLAEMGLDPA